MSNTLNKAEAWKGVKDAKMGVKAARIEKRYSRKMDKATLLKTPELKALAESPPDEYPAGDSPAFRARNTMAVEQVGKARAGEWRERKVSKLQDKQSRVETRYQRKLKSI